jgi:hypothetical protein
MTRHVSGVFLRTEGALLIPGTTVRLLGQDHRSLGRATVLELGTSTLRLSAARPPALGKEVIVAITLPGRYIEFEVSGVVDWELDRHFGISLRYLTARQAYALTLAQELLRAQPREAQAEPHRARSTRA